MDFNSYRFLAAFISGSMLGLSGSLVQGVAGNPLASPSTLGLNALSALVVMVAHVACLYWNVLPALEATALLLFLFLTILIFLMAYKKSAYSEIVSNKVVNNIERIVLIGLCFNLFVGAVFSIIQFSFFTLNLEFPTQLWYGNFRFIHRDAFVLFAFVAALTYLLAVRSAKQLRTLAFGADFAAGLGINVHKLQLKAFFLALVGVGIVNCMFGVFAFVGLVFPHILRSLPPFRYNFAREIVIGPFVTGLMFLGLDAFCQEVSVYGAEIPVGMLSSFVGTFILTSILVRRFRRSAFSEVK
jgi:iron complex transport system permease protein